MLIFRIWYTAPVQPPRPRRFRTTMETGRASTRGCRRGGALAPNMSAAQVTLVAMAVDEVLLRRFAGALVGALVGGWGRVAVGLTALARPDLAAAG